MLANGNKDLASHVAALLGTSSLVLDVNASSTLFNEELGKLHGSSEAAMARISIGDDGSKVVNVGELCALILGGSHALLALFAIVEELSHEEMADLVGDSSLGMKLGHATVLHM